MGFKKERSHSTFLSISTATITKATFTWLKKWQHRLGLHSLIAKRTLSLPFDLVCALGSRSHKWAG